MTNKQIVNQVIQAVESVLASNKVVVTEMEVKIADYRNPLVNVLCPEVQASNLIEAAARRMTIASYGTPNHEADCAEFDRLEAFIVAKKLDGFTKI